MGRNQHSKDRLFITASEWAIEYGGKKREKRGAKQILPFDHCALSLQRFENPVCTIDGVMFDVLHIVPFLKKHKVNPINSEPMRFKDLVQLQMHKNAEGKWHCPVTFKVFNDNTKIAAIKTTGHVYAFDAIHELNIKRKNWKDLMTDAPFKRSDIIMLSDPEDQELKSRRDISNFSFLKQMRDEETQKHAATPASSNIRATASQASLFKEIEATRERHKAEEVEAAKKRADDELADLNSMPDLKGIRLLNPTMDDVNPGSGHTSGLASGSLTSSGIDIETRTRHRPATLDEIREARWKVCRRLRKKGYAQLQTNMGNLNLEIHSDWVPRTAENFMGLIEKGFYDNLKFHRLISGFMVQGGDPDGDGTGGESLWGDPFVDEFDSRLVHNDRGILSMANSGRDTNRSQFFILFRGARHLDNKHAVFGRVVGGLNVLDRIEKIKTGKGDVPEEEIIINKAVVFENPLTEATKVLEQDIRDRQERKLIQRADRQSATGGNLAELPKAEKERRAAAAANSRTGWHSNVSQIESGGDSGGVGKYLGAAASQTVLPSKTGTERRKASASSLEDDGLIRAKKPKVKASSSLSDFSSW